MNNGIYRKQQTHTFLAIKCQSQTEMQIILYCDKPINFWQVAQENQRKLLLKANSISLSNFIKKSNPSHRNIKELLFTRFLRTP